MDWKAFVAEYQRFLQPLLQSLVILVLAVLVAAVLKRVMNALEPRVPLPGLLFGMFRRLAKWSVWGFAIYLVLTVWGLPLNTVLGMLGALFAMVAIGFVAVWSLLSNILSAFVLTAFGPFRVGDEVELVGDNVRGRVVGLTLLFVSLETPDGDHFRVPNNFFFQKIFRCHAGKKTSDLRARLLHTDEAK
jgi:small-conductance mechanosensitive channel